MASSIAPTGAPTTAPTISPLGADLTGLAILVVYGPPIVSYFVSLMIGELDINQAVAQRFEDPFELEKYLLEGHVYSGHEPEILPQGVPFLGIEPGLLEDLIYYFINESIVVGMIFCDKRHPFSRQSRQLMFAAVHSMVFLFYGVVGNDELRGNLSSADLFDYVVVVPLQVILTKLFVYLFKCKLCHRKDRTYQCCWKTVREATFVIALICAAFGVLLVWLGDTILQKGVSKSGAMAIIAKYFYEVTLVAGALELLVLLRFFIPLWPDFLMFGKSWYRERMETDAEVATLRDKDSA